MNQAGMKECGSSVKPEVRRTDSTFFLLGLIDIAGSEASLCLDSPSSGECRPELRAFDGFGSLRQLAALFWRVEEVDESHMLTTFFTPEAADYLETIRSQQLHAFWRTLQAAATDALNAGKHLPLAVEALPAVAIV